MKKRLISILMVVVMAFAFCSVALANSNVSALIPDYDEEIRNGDIQFSDSMGRSYERVKAIMDAQHPYLVRFSEVTSEWEKSNSFPDYFAGAYFNDEEFIIKATSTDTKVADEVRTLFGKAVLIEPAKYSYTELLEMQSQAIDLFDSSDLEVRTWVDMKTNTVGIEIAEEANAITRETAANHPSAGLISSFSSAPFDVRFVKNIEVEKTVAIGNNTGCYYTGSGNTSSLGCWLAKSGVNWIVTAGHCSNGTKGTSSKVYTSSSKTTEIGYVEVNTYSSTATSVGDCGVIKPLSSNTPSSGYQTVSGVYSGSLIPNQTVVLRSGKSSSSSGYVTLTNVTLTYSGDTGKRTGMVQANYTTVTGESGNCVVTGNNLVCGVQGGGNGPSYFTPISTIAQLIP